MINQNILGEFMQKQCENGHFYNSNQYTNCPFCNNSLSSINKKETKKISDMTVLVKPSDIKVTPIVGWLVSLSGENKGKDYKVSMGANSIGRDSSNRIIIEDSKISGEDHAIIFYNSRDNSFTINHDEGQNLTYLNDKPVYEASELKSYDIVEFGDAKFLFISLCNDKFTWN